MYIIPRIHHTVNMENRHIKSKSTWLNTTYLATTILCYTVLGKQCLMAVICSLSRICARKQVYTVNDMMVHKKAANSKSSLAKLQHNIF